MGWEEDIDAAIQASHEAFVGKFKNELRDLVKLAPEDIDGITPDTTDVETYEKLIAVVKEASRKNISHAELGQRIKQLGDVAITIAKKVGGLAATIAL
jgi:methionine aminopeptidase